MQAPPAYQGGPSFSEQELAYYRHFFSQVDTSGSGRISGLQAATFLSSSGLERKVLKQIWDISDRDARGELGPSEFNVALRLVAHAQAGRQVVGELVFEEPPSPPRFEAAAGPPAPAPLQQPPARGRSPAPGDERRVPSGRDLRKYGRLFYSRVVLNGASHLSAAEAKDLFERSGLGTEILQQVWYLADHDSDGQLSWPEFVLSMHLIRRSLAGQPLPEPPANLPRELVEVLGSLDTPEAYARQPSRSPRSLSGASTPFGSTSPERPATEEAPAPPPSAWPGGAGFGGAGAADVGAGAADFGGAAAASSQGFGSGGGFADGFGAKDPGLPAAPEQGKRSRRGRKSRDKDSDGFGGLGSPTADRPRVATQDSDGFGGLGSPTADRSSVASEDTSAFGTFPEPAQHSEPPRQRPSLHPAPSFGDDTSFGNLGFGEELSAPSRPGRSRRRDEHFEDERRSEGTHSPDFGMDRRKSSGDSLYSNGGGGGQPVEHLEVLIEAEKKLVQRLRLDTDALDEELSRLEEACREEERASARETAECERVGRERGILLQQLEASQRQLNELKAEYKGLHIESVLLRRDTDHYSQEADFLRRLLDEGARDTQVLQQSIEYLEQSNRSLGAHTKALEEARKDVLAQVSTEKEQLRKEEREALLAKNALETLRAGGGAETLAQFTSRAGGGAETLAQFTSRQTAEMQGLAEGGSRRSWPPPEKSSPPWAGGFPAPPEAGAGGGFFAELGAAPAPVLGKDIPYSRPPAKAPAGLQLREGV